MNAKVKQFKETAGKFVSKNSSQILIGLGIVGEIVSVILAVKATPKALKHAEQKKAEVNAIESEDFEGPIDHYEERELTLKEFGGAVYKDYIPSAITLVTSIGCIIAGTKVSINNIAAANSMINVLQTDIRTLKEKTKEVVGERKATAIHDAIVSDKCSSRPYTEEKIIDIGDGNTVVYDPFCDRYFRTSISNIERAMNAMTIEMADDDICPWRSLNDFYRAAHFPEAKLADRVGWNRNHLKKYFGDAIIGSRPTSMLDSATDMPIYIIGFDKPPEWGFDEDDEISNYRQWV